MKQAAGSRWFVMLLCILFCLSAASGLWAQAGVFPPPVPESRPQRTKVPDGRGAAEFRASANPSFLASYSSSLLTPENLNQPLTQHYIQRYSSSGGISWINSIIANGALYFPYIKAEIAQRGLPPEIVYLPFIESGYIGTARSSSGAMGIWQFMMNSIGSLQVNDLVDERRDFRKATVAALLKLEENYRAVGNWPMALAAYNAGLGAVNRSIKKAGSNDYWVLSGKGEFKVETTHYVPKFLAVSYILSKPRQFNLNYWPATTEWAAIRPERQVSLDIIAAETGTDRFLLRQLNHELLHGITPPDQGYELKVPLSQAELIAGIIQKEDVRLLRYYRYQIKYGDTLSVLSRHYGVPLNMIEQYNPGILNRYLKIGETIVIPAFRDLAPYTSTATAPVEQPARGNFGGTHVISEGDTLWSLGIRYRIDPVALAQANDMDLNQILSIGKSLKVPIIEE